MKKLRVLAALLAAVCFCTVACTPSAPVVDPNPSESSDKGIIGYPEYDGNNALSWVPLYLTTSAMRKQGIVAATGNNQKTALSVFPGGAMLVGTRDAGILRRGSEEDLWIGRFDGLDALGVEALAIDPNNGDFVLAVSTGKGGGIYRSENGGMSWMRTEASVTPVEGAEISIVFDPSSYRADTKRSAVAYISGISLTEDAQQNLLLLTEDSGKTFRVTGEIAKNASVAVHPTKGYVYVADDYGFYRSINRGFAYDSLFEGKCDAIGVSKAAPDTVLLVHDAKIYKSTDSGMSFEEETAMMPDIDAVKLFVSPYDPQEFLTYFMDGKGKLVIFRSEDGGFSWGTCTVEDSPFRHSDNAGKMMFRWNGESTVYAIIYNAVFRSTDGGASFVWDGNGDGSFSMEGPVGINIQNTDLMAFAVDGKTLAFSTDSGRLWDIRVQGDENMELKSVYPCSRSRLIALMYDTVNRQYEIRISKNAGETFDPIGVYGCLPYAKMYADPTDTNILFASNMRSEDGGKSWKEMELCHSVLAHNPVSPNELFGVYKTTLVVSYNHGKNWNRIADIGEMAGSLSYDYSRKILYAAVGDRLLTVSLSDGSVEDITASLVKNQFGKNNVLLVEVDPAYPDVVYVGGKGDGYIDRCSVIVSENGGKDWSVVSFAAADNELFSVFSGGVQPLDMFLTQDRELIVFSAQFGMSRLGAYEPVAK